MSQQTTKPGRRTPLSLGPPKVDSSDKALPIRGGKATVNIEKLSHDYLPKQAKNAVPTDEKVDNKPENGQSNAQNNGSSTKKDTGNGDASAANSKTSESPKQGNDKGKLLNEIVKEDKNASSKSNEKPVEKLKSSNEKATIANEKQKPLNDKEENGAKSLSRIEEPKVDVKNNPEKEVRESVRQKQLREEKEENGKVVPPTTEKIPESPKIKEKRKSDVTPTKTPKTGPSESLLAEKSLKGFNENLEEADSLKITDSPMPSKEGKVLKFNQALPIRGARNVRSDKLDDASLVVNLSTVSEQSNESTSNNAPPERSYSLRHITGRRSTRPLREISFEFCMRESYQKIQNDFNDSTSSTNAACSSNSPKESIRSLSTSNKGHGFKRSMDDEIVESPKRSRFDFGLLDFVSSPVTKLREKFSRANLSTSTPNKLIITETADKTEDIPSGIEAENFIVDEEMPKVDLGPVKEDIEKKLEIETDIDADVDVESPAEICESRKSRCIVM